MVLDHMVGLIRVNTNRFLQSTLTTLLVLVVFSIPHFAFAAQTYGNGVYGAGLYGQGDITPPVVSLIAPLNGATVSGTSVLFTASSSDDTGIFGVQFTVDGSSVGTAGTSSPYSYSWNSTSVADGSHVVGVVASDAAGNTATSSVTVTVSNTGPTFSGIASSTAATGATISWTTNKSATTLLNYGTTISYGLASSTAGTSTAHTIVLSGLSPSTLYHFQLSGTDAQTNVGTSSDLTFTTAALPVSAPSVTIQAATGIATSSATLNGTLVNNNNATSTIEGFNYGTTLAYGSTASTTGSFSPGAFSQALMGLVPNTLYHVQAFAVNSAGVGTSSDQTFTTTPLPVTAPTVTIQSASGISTSSATLNATLVSNNNATSTTEGFNYGTTVSYGLTASTTGSFSPGTFSQLIASLSPSTTYHIQAFATNSAGTGTSSDQTFTTTALPVTAPTVTIQATSGISTSSATLNGTLVNNNNATSTVEGFNYGTTLAYGSTASTTGSFSPSAFNQLAASLTPGTLYHVQAFAINSAGVGTSSDQTFTTAALPVSAPLVTIQSATSVATSSATFNGTLVNNNNATSTIQGFNYGVTTAYGATASTTGSFTPGTFSQLISSLAPNTLYHVQAFATNSAGTGTSSDITFTTTALPITVPTVTVQATSGISTSSASLNGTLVNNNNATSTIQGFNYGITLSYGATASSTGSFSTGAFNQLVTSLTPGTLYHVQAFATNSAGTGTSSDLTFTTAALPVSAPTVSIQAATSVATSSATLNGTLVNNNNATSTVEGFNYGTTLAYGSTASTTGSFSPSSFSQSLVGLVPNTLYHYQTYAINSAGTGTSSDQTFTTSALTVSAPSVTIQAASGISTSSATFNGTLVNNNNATSTVTGFNYGTTLAYGQSASSTGIFTPSTFAQLVTSLIPNTLYHVQAFAVNSAGTGTSTDLTFTTAALPVTVPTVTVQSISGISTSTATLNGTLVNNNNATSTIEGFNYGTTLSYGATASSTGAFIPGTFNQLVSSLIPGTLYHVQAFAINSAGVGTSSDQTFTTAALPVTAPTVTTAVATTVTDTTAILNGAITVDGNASSTLQGFNIGTTIAYGLATTTTVGTFGAGSFSTTTTALTPVTLYHYRAYATNTAGTGYGADQTFTTTAAPDVTPPIISAVASSTGQTSASISWTTNEPATSVVNYGATTAYGTASSSALLATSHVINLSGLTAASLYHFQITTADASANATSSVDYRFTTAPIPDTTPPVVSATAATPTNISATITWTTDEPATSLVNYGVTSAYGSAANVPGLSTSHSVVLTGLTATTTYHYQIQTADASSNLTTTSDAFFTTAPNPDVTPPVVTSIVSSPADKSVSISWTTNEPATSIVNLGTTASYGTASSSVLLTTSHSIMFAGLTPLTTYHYQIQTADASNNVSTSSDRTFTTNADVTPPVISSISATPTTSGVTITWTTDEPSTAQAVYGVTSSYTASTTLDSTLATTHTVAITGLAASSVYHFEIISTDSYGNTATSTDQVFSTNSIPTSGGGGGGVGGGGSSGGSGGGSSTPPPSSLPITPITPSIFTTNPVTTTVNTNTIGIVPTIGGFSGGVPFTLNLAARSHNEEVTRLQQVLVFKGLLDAQYVTGFLGTLTKRALITYQIQNGIPPLGTVGPLTRVVLNQDYAQASSLTFSAVGNPLQEVSTAPITDNTTGSGAGTNGTGIIIRNNVKIGSVGNDVRALQQFLSNYPAFYPSGTINGIYGPLTRAAVGAFQLNFNLVTSPSSAGYGKVGPVTRQKINELLH